MFQKKRRWALFLAAGLLATVFGGCEGQDGRQLGEIEERKDTLSASKETEGFGQAETFGPEKAKGRRFSEAAGPKRQKEPEEPEDLKTAGETSLDTEEEMEETGEEKAELLEHKPQETPFAVAAVSPVPDLDPVTPSVKEEDVKVETEEGTISKPDHPDTIRNEKLIFIGDSRTEAIRNAVSSVAVDTVWSCLSGKGYDWMASVGVPQVEGDIEKNTSVIFLMGVNDLYNVDNYIHYINEKAKEWAGIGVQTYYVSVGPVEDGPYCSNAQIESFNTSMENNLSGVKYIDVYHHLTENGYSTVDGLHYPDDVSMEIYNYIIENLEEVRSGIWG